jgi:drug/metabolite transporter (DMT)-like permease
MTRVFPAFSVAFAVLYVACMHFNIAAVIYYPRLGQWHVNALNRDGPPMFMFGWMIYAFVGAIAVSLVSALIPKSTVDKIWSGWTWAICLGAVVLSTHLMYGMWLAPKAPAATKAPVAEQPGVSR